MNKIKSSVATLAATLFIANQAGAAGTWSEARNDAMGGTGGPLPAMVAAY